MANLSFQRVPGQDLAENGPLTNSSKKYGFRFGKFDFQSCQNASKWPVSTPKWTSLGSNCGILGSKWSVLASKCFILASKCSIFSFKLVICRCKVANLSFQRVPGQDLAENGPFAHCPT